MRFRYTLAAGVATALLTTVFLGAGIELPSGAACAAQFHPRVSFGEDVLPLLQFKCAACHMPGGEGALKSGFDLSSFNTLMKGTKYGPMIVAGDPDASNLMRMLDWRVAADIRMPHSKKQLSICDRDLIRNWILDGAKND